MAKPDRNSQSSVQYIDTTNKYSYKTSHKKYCAYAMPQVYILSVTYHKDFF